MKNNFKIYSFTILSLLLIVQNSVQSQSGSLDQSFSGDGKLTSMIGSGDDRAFGLTTQANGKIIVVGSTVNGSQSDFAIVRYNSDGTPDNSFSGDGKLVIDFNGGDDEARSVIVLNNGNILISGSASIGNSYDFALVMITADGRLQTSFSGDGKLNIDFNKLDDFCYSMQVFNNKIYLGGQTLGAQGEEFAIAVINMDGSPDLGFDADGKANYNIGPSPDFGTAIAVQTDGKIVLTGYTGSDFLDQIATIRCLENGMLDVSFSGDGKIITDIGPDRDRAYAVAIQKDQKIIVAGYTYHQSGNDFALVRYLMDGSLDKSFSNDGIVVQGIGTRFDEASAMVLQEDGKILVAGQAAQPATDADFGLARFTESGVLDKEFSGDGVVITPIGNGKSEDESFAIAIQPDGKIVIAGEAENGTNLDFAVARYHSGLTVGTFAESLNIDRLELYPNPTTQHFNLGFTLTKEQTLTIALCNHFGQALYTFTNQYSFSASRHHLYYQLPESINSGIYFLHIQSKQKSIKVLPLFVRKH
ncbi:MAG: T9SS type A sorting domain-containing protein [Saprospiraceae bacterium]|nr:T9SS type A sorting domain-containing protein [Saprospiraceae bacterium]